jgi:hypothetical protein
MQVFFFFFFFALLSLLFVSGAPEIKLGASWLSHVLPSALITNRLEFKKPRFRDSTEVVHAATKARWWSFYAALNAAVCVMAAEPKLI